MEGEEERGLKGKGLRPFGIPLRLDFWLLPLAAVAGWLACGFQFSAVPVFAAAALLSVFLHQLGHALVGRWLGGKEPEMFLVFFGGLCSFGRSGFTCLREALMIASGPLANFFLGGSLLLFLRSSPGHEFPDPLLQFFRWLVLLNLALGGLNLLPVLPLDGGHLFQLFLGRRLEWVALVGLVASLSIILLALALQAYLLLPLFAYFGWRNLATLLACRRFHQGA